MSYVVYVNHPTNKAIVHSGQCHKYRLRKRDSTHNGFWKAPFSSTESALSFARSTGKKIVDTCAFCI